jgi:anhydro-N-acetylmuramic acid kinase
MAKYKVIGIMSGTSLDGLDIAYCEFVCSSTRPVWRYTIKAAETIRYSKAWKGKLSHAYRQKPGTLIGFDKEFGKFIGREALKFISKYKARPDFISSHGHTIFHQPDKGITYQAGNGQVISDYCRLPVVCGFRSGDVALGGQGAPLVPLVDKLLFSKYRFCLNLGGFANISFDNARGQRIAFDICPVNIVLNELAGKSGMEYDEDGKMAAAGAIHAPLLARLNSLPYYKQGPPKSLGREWVETVFSKVLKEYQIPVKDLARTVCEHVAIQIGKAISLQVSGSKSKLLVSGGGVYNKFLLKRIQAMAPCRIISLDDQTIQFKEAMAFAFLGVLKMRKEINILKSVTGAQRNSSGGKVFYVN